MDWLYCPACAAPVNGNRLYRYLNIAWAGVKPARRGDAAVKRQQKKESRKDVHFKTKNPMSLA